MAEERLQKILARAGVTSRRKAETLITAGRVRVDGKIVTELGKKANPRRSVVELDGKRLEPEPFCYGIFHKPRGMVTTLSDPEGRPTAHDVLRQVGVRVVPVGRLDFNTSGALLFTNDGDFAQALTHAKGKAAKVYAAKVSKPVDERTLGRWQESIDIEGKKTRPAAVRVLRREGDKTWLEVTIAEGRNRQVRRLGEHAGTAVDRLARLSHAGIGTEGLKPGQWRLLTIDELKDLKKRFGVPEKIRGILEVPRNRGSFPKAGARKAAVQSASPKKRSPAGASSSSQKGRAEGSSFGRAGQPRSGKAALSGNKARSGNKAALSGHKARPATKTAATSKRGRASSGRPRKPR